MPYIPKARRSQIDLGASLQNPGELNYMLTDVIIDYIMTHGLSYKTINDILGAMEGAKLEFYRRFVTPYENNRMNENGDVYPFDGDVELTRRAYEKTKAAS